MAEPFSWTKLLSGFSSTAGWVKAAAIAVRVLVICLILGIPAFTYHQGLKTGKNEGYRTGYAQAIKDNPPVQITGNGATVNQNVCPKRNNFGLTAWGYTLGVCK